MTGRSIFGDYPDRTRMAATGLIRENEELNVKSFRCRARKSFNRVPPNLRTGSILTVKKKLMLWVNSNIPID